MTRDIVQVGIGCASAPLDLRERMSPSDTQRRLILDRLAGVAPEQAMLATCERLEWYGAASRGIEDAVVQAWSEIFGIRSERVHHHIVVRRDNDAARHLFRVAAGLESRIVGEHHVLGQIRSAFRLATADRWVGPVLSTLWRSAIHAGKRVRSETCLGGRSASIASCAVEAIDRDESNTIVVLGAGKVAQDVLRALALTDSRRVVIVSRGIGRAAELANAFGAEFAAMDRLRAVLSAADAVVACTSSPRFVLTPDQFGYERIGRLTIVDLGVPRNVDPAVGELGSVRLVHLESLAAGQADAAAVIEAHRITDEELAKFQQWRQHRRVARDIARLVLNKNGADRRGLHRQIMRIKAEVAA